MIKVSASKRSFTLLVLAASALAPALPGQSYSPVLNPVSSVPDYFYCVYGGYALVGASIQLSNGVYFQTNAHYHGPPATEPVSSLSTTSGTTNSSGYLEVMVNTTLVGQAEYIDEQCSYPGISFTRYRQDFAVGYGDLLYNDHPNIWIKIGGSDTGGNSGHGTTAYNRYMMSAAAYGLYNATIAYLNTHPGMTQVCTNDMALYIGGKFDICNELYPGCSAVTPWAQPHASHDRGSAADVAGPGSGQCPVNNQVNIAGFLAACGAAGFNKAHSVPEGNHAHCNWLDPATYPH